MRQILNVAEKPSVAREVSKILGNGQQKMIESESKYNPIFQFDFKLQKQPVNMYFTSVTGHIIQQKFEDKYKNWSSFNPSVLLDKQTQIFKYVEDDKINIERNLLKWARLVDMLILWLDCDREGEAIAFEVIDICNKSKDNLLIKRAWFSSLDKQNINNAINNLIDPRKELAEAVDSRSEIDLRIGSAFTVFQTLNLKNRFNSLSKSNNVISYGPCQFPTLGFVVDRYNQIQNFKDEQFWFINPTYQWKDGKNTLSIDLKWNRGRLFNKDEAAKFYDQCVLDESKQHNPKGIVTQKKERDTNKIRPYPLTTVDLTKQGCRILKMGSEKIMQVADKLYQSGYISYPRTETNKYPETFNNEQLLDLVKIQKQSKDWGFYACNLVDLNRFQRPREGKHDDKAHPPIHPIKLANRDDLMIEEWKVYEFITRHFLATCGKDAVGSKTEVEIKFNEEIFNIEGLVVKETNYLDVWSFDKWNDSIVPPVEIGQTIIPTKIILQEGKTTPPKLLTESELIDQMNKNGIGTDATMHEHIKTIQNRGYAQKNTNSFMFTPTPLGLALCNSYEKLGFTLSKPDLRAKMERLMTDVAEGKTTKEIIINEIMQEMKEIYSKVEQNKELFIKNVGEQLKESDNSLKNQQEESINCQCGQCGQNMRLEQNSYLRLLVCDPCSKSYKVPKSGNVKTRPEKCPICKFQVIEIITENKHSYTVCPSCYNNPPYDQKPSNNQTYLINNLSDLTNKNQTMACYQCLKKDCSLSGGHKHLPLYSCPCCYSQIQIKQKIKDKKEFLGCSSYPRCEWGASLPKDITSVNN